MSSTPPPAVAGLRWLQLYRRTTLAMLGCSVGIGVVMGALAAPLPSVLPLLLAFAAVEVAQTWWLRRHAPPAWAPEAHLAIDLLFFTAFIGVFRAGDSPGLSLLIIQVGLAALLLSRRRAWFVTAAVVGIHAVASFFLSRVDPYSGGVPSALQARPLNQVLTFTFAALWVSYFLTEIRQALRDREARLQEALDDRSRNERLVALGTQAAGIAHELGTPLSSIDLLAAEAASDPEYALEALRLLRDQVRRCRGILDRIRGSTSKTVSAEIEEFIPVLRDWLQDWTEAGLDRDPPFTEIDERLEGVGVKGAADEWRGIVWSTLDNARKAGSPITVRARLEGSQAVLQIDDSGPGPTPDVAARAGEPFFTQWPGATGRGLGLYVARTFARRFGGEVTLSRRSGGGGRLEIRFATMGASTSEP